MHTTWLQCMYLVAIAVLLLAESSAHVLGRPGAPGGRHLTAARMGAARRSQRIKARREAGRRRASEEEGATEALAAEEGALRDTSHSAVKAIKSRLARSRKIPGASVEAEEEAEMEPEGSERQLQARVAAAEKAMLTQRSAGGDVEETAEEDMSAAEALELEMTGVLDDEKEQDTLDMTMLHKEDKAAAALHSHEKLSKMGLRSKVNADEEEDLALEARSQHRAPRTLHRQDTAQRDDNDADEDDDGSAAEPEPEPALHKGLKAPDWADNKNLPQGAVTGGQDTSAAKKGREAMVSVPPAQQRPERGKLPAVKKLPPWFREGFDPDSPEKPRPRVGSGRAHAARVLSHEEKWLRAHQHHLSLAADGWDVILFGDDLIEAWRGTFLGQAYGPFSEIPAVWDATFGAQSYSAIAAGIAGDGVEHLRWRLENGELPPHAPPKVIVLAVGGNSKGMAGECRVDLAEETAVEMSQLLYELREAMPQTQLVLMAPLPKGEYWPNRCTPAFRVIKEALQDFSAEQPEHVHFLDLSASFLVRPAREIRANVTANIRQEINEMFMPDAQHPSAAGMRMIAAELEPLVRRLISAARADMDTI